MHATIRRLRFLGMSKLLVLLVALGGCSAAAPEPKNSVPRDDADPGDRGESFTKGDYASHVRSLRRMLRQRGLDHLNVRIEDPFVVIGDGTFEELERRSLTVRWAADMLEHDLFANRPNRILDIYLFGTAETYAAGVRTLTGEAPSTPYGFYSPSHDAMYMDIATGGGTLVHEIVHPYVEADFPGAPPWLNEGLGSLFEQSAERGGHIVGLTNWRLPGLQKTIRRGQLQSFATLTKLPTDEFYGDDSGTNYAQSRYLLYYLQETGKLRRFYRSFRDNHVQDPTGYRTLIGILREPDMRAFQQRWQRYVDGLRFP